MATIVAAAGGGNWNATGTWVGGVVPTAADDVQFSATSGNVTINVAAVCRSLDCSGGGGSNYTGTLTHAAAITLSIGTSTAGLSNIALQLVSSMTYTLGNASTSAISFVSTATSVQTIATGGKVLGNWSVNGNGSKYQLTDANNNGSLASVTLTLGQLDTNGQTCSWGLFASNNSNTRTLTLGASNITLTGGSNNVWNTASSAGMTLNANTSTITANGTNASFSSGALAFNTVVYSGTATSSFNATSATFVNLTRIATAVKTDALSLAGNLTVTGTLTLTGNSTINRLLVQSNTVGITRTITAAAVVITSTDFIDIAGTGVAAPFTGVSLGDCLGNSGITFDTPTTQTHVAGTGGSWSTAAKWTSRIPLPQDDVIVDSNTTGSLVADMPRAGRNVDFTGFAGSYSQSGTPILFGSLTLSAAMAIAAGSAMTFWGRGTHTITSNGKTITGAVIFSGFGGTYTLQDAFASGSSITLTSGSLDTNNMAVSSTLLLSAGTVTRALTLGTSVWSLTSTAASAIVSMVSTGLTLSAANSTFAITTTSASTRIFAGGGSTFGTLTYTVAGSTGELDITGANTFRTINFSDASNARILNLPASTITTITDNFNVVGTAGKLMSIISSSAGTAATLSKASGTVAADYLSLKDSAATGGAAWYAGANSTNVSNVSGWTFSAAPASSAANFLPFFN